MDTRLLWTGQLLQVAALVTGIIGMAVGFLVLDNMIAHAAPPADDPITTLEIKHQCPDPIIGETVPANQNDTYQAATTLQMGQPQTHTLDSGGNLGTHDKDWFVFNISAGQVFSLATTFPTTSVLTITEISLFTSTSTAQSDKPASTSTGGELGWLAPSTPTTQSFWARIRNPHSAGQDPINNFCDVLYQIKLKQPGDLDNSGTVKESQIGQNNSLTYTVSISNTGEPLQSVVVTDTFPAGVNVLTVTVSPAGGSSILVADTNSFTWTGTVTGYSAVQFTVNTTVTQGTTTSLQNTIWIRWNSTVITRSTTATAADPGGVFLPIILKNSA